MITSYLQNLASSGKKFIVCALFLSITGIAFSQTQTFTVNGSFPVPSGVYSILVECWGAGGAGGGSNSNGDGGSGGGGGGYTTAILNVTPGQIIPVTVGVGGTGVVSSTGNNGTLSSFLTLIANGGTGGGANRGPVGTGGTASGGTTNTTGSNGTAGAASGGNGGAGANGGAGGTGSTNATGGNGSAPGGGGGGGERGNGNNYAGGNGGAGRIIITWSPPVYYSYQTGSWNTASTWTLDPSGTTQVGNSVPGNNDKVTILTGRTVTLPANIAATGLDITIEEGGFLDLSTFQFTAGLSKLSGQGTLVISSAVFPTPVTTNTFVNAGGGTTEYRTNITLPSQATYNNLTINASGLIVTQTIDLTLNGNLYVKSGTFRINDNTTRRLKLTVNGDVSVDAGASLTVGTGVTNSTTVPTGITGGTAPFINYYDLQSHRIVLNGNFTNNGTVRFTNLIYPVFNAFPSTTAGATTGFATVYFQGASNSTLFCSGTTDFYNLVLNKGIDQSFKLTIYTSGSSYANFRLFGANTAGGDGGGANPNLKKALWIRTGTLVLEGLTMIPSLTEGTASEGGANPNSDFCIPANGSLVLNGTDVVVLSTADDYREVNLAYNTSAADNNAMGITTGGTGCALSLYGKLQLNNGYLSTRESGGIITSSVSPGQFIINNGTVDAKQFLGSTGAASYQQNGGIFILRGRFRRTFTYASIANLIDASPATLSNVRAVSGTSGTFGSFNLNNANNVFAMSDGIIRIYDICGDGTSAAQQEAFDVLSSISNSNVTGGTLEIAPYSGSAPANDSPNFLISSNAKLGSLNINRVSSNSTVLLNTYPLILLNNLTLTSGALNSNNLNVTVGGNLTIENGTVYTPGNNATILNGLSTQTFTVNLASPLALYQFTIDKPAGSIVNFAGTQTAINVNDNFRLLLGTLNDNGNSINVFRNVYNSGIHTGNGEIAFVGTSAQAIDGNGIFNNIELNNNTGIAAPVSLSASITINGTLTFSCDKLFNIGIYNLRLNSSASIVNGGPLRYIQTAGNSGDGGLTKEYSAITAFLFPIGAPSASHAGVPRWTPATIGFTTSPSVFGSITVVPVGYEHPATTANGQSLTYFWSVKSSGFSGIQPNSVNHTFIYDQSDVLSTEASYTPSLYDRTAYTWYTGTNANPPINISNNTITDWTTPSNSHAYLDADYTAGISAFGAPAKFYSRQTGLWGQTSTWWSPAIGTAATTTPGLNDIVIIRTGHTVSFATPASPDYLRVENTDPHYCASLQIETGAVLDVRFNPGSNFGMVLSHPNGNGTIKVTTNWNYPTTYVFPSGDFSDFNVNMGTTELYTTNTNPGPEFYLPENVSSYGNLVLSPVGGSNVMFPNQNIQIYGDLITRGENADSWFCPSWGTTYPGSIAAVAKTIHINGNMDIQGGSLIWYANGALAENFVIEGNVRISPLSALYIYSGATNQSMTIGGSLINNADGIAHVSTPSKCDFTNITVTFNGPDSASITNTVGTPVTTFSQVIVNKGNSRTATLTLDISGTLTTPANNWLTLQNGTFRYMRNVNTDFTVSTSSPFTIPATACFHSEYTTANNILIANNTANTNDVFLNGKLKIVSGNVYIGPINGTTNNNNDIEYSGSGESEIEILGGTLVVNGQIRQGVSSNAGILKYKQSGGAVTINGNAAITSNAKLEILNSGEFNMSAGSITILRGGGGSNYGDLYLRPASGSVTGGDIFFTNNLSNSNQQYLLDATLPLNNLTITGRTAATASTATVKLMVNPLVVNGNLSLVNAQSILDVNSVYNIPVTINGNFTNNGSYNHFNNLTTFRGGSQLLLGAMPTTPTDFYDLNVSPVTKLTLSKEITVTNNLTIGNGTLECLTYLVNVKGNIENNGTYTNTTATSGIILNGTTQQHLSGTGTFGQIELNNGAGSIIDNSITLTRDLVLNNGIFDITEFLLTLGQNSSIVAKGTAFSASKMITSDGVWSNVGILKVFGTPLATTFTYPLGTPGKYTPADLTVTANGSVGSIRVNNINSRHPAMVDPANVLKYYWEVESTGISGFSGNLLLSYKTSDVLGGPESSYVAAVLLTPGTNWSKAAPGPGTDNVNETNHTITFNFNNSSNMTGQYTAGNDAAIPSTVPQYTSNKNGNWTDNTIWTPSGGTSYPCPVGGPNGFIVTIDHIVTANANYCFTYKTTINNQLKAVAPFYGHNFGSVYGNGTLYLESEVFPAGRYGTFLDCSGNGTIEYGGTGTYNINATLYSSIPRIFISGSGRRILPDKDLIICKQLKIDDAGAGALTLDNSINNRRLIINGTFERYNAGSFNSGSGSTAVVEFGGSAAQTIGGTSGDFIGTNAFNNFEINNSSGLSINNNGGIEINGNLLLTNGLISTTSTNKLTINNYSISCVYPDGGSASSYIDGPLIKKLNQGDPLFKFPVGKRSYGLGNNLSLRSTQTGTLFWVVEYNNPNAYSTFSAPLTSVNTKEYWNVSGVPATSKAYIDISWNSTSDLTPLMTQNGLSDMRIAEHNGSNWVEMSSDVISGSDNYNGSVETSTRAVIISGSRNFTLGCVNTPKPRIKMSPAGPICGTGGIPVTLTTTLSVVAPFTVNYTENGTPKSITPASFPTTIPTIAAGGIYILTGFTYNYPAGTPQTGVFDQTSVTVYAVPTTATAGSDQSLCGATSATLAGNAPVSGTGLWSIISGSGGTIVTPTVRNSVFNGTNGSTYVLRWTISNGTCVSFDDVTVSFPLLAAQPAGFTTSTSIVCQGNSGVVYTIPNDPSVTYNWSYTGSGATINGTSNSVTVDFNSASTSGTLNVTATNSCNTSAPQSLAITVNNTPAITVQPTAPAAVCSGTGTQSISVTATGTGITYSWRRGGTAVVNGGVISGQGTATLTLTNPTAANAGNYDVVVSGTCAPPATSSAVTVTVNAAPAITAQPTAPAAVCSGSGTQTISVTATGAGLTYSWRRGGTAVVNGGVISGQGTATLTLTNPTAANAGSYDVVISGTCTPAVTSSAVTVSVNAAPAITAQPTAPAAVCSGSGTQTISVTATGAGLTYSWRRGGTAVVNGGVISGQGTATLTLTNPTAANAGSYDVVVSGTCTPAVTSSAVTVTVNAAPAITAQPSAPAAVCSGSGTQTISVTATGAGLTYSWRRGGTAVVNGGVISGQGTATLTLTNPTAANAGSYDVVISGTCTPAVTSSAVTVSVNAAPAITAQPTAPAAVCSGSGTQTISVTATGAGLTYSWRRGGTAVVNGGVISGQGTATLTLTNPTAANAGNYDVVISGTCTPAVTSSAVTVTVNAAPAITAQPSAPAAVCSGSGTQTISVTATGAGLTYSWRRGGTAVVNGGVISGQGTATLTLTNPTAANAGNYDVVVSGTCTPAVTSSAVTVTVNAAPAITAQPTAPAAVCSGSGTQTISVTATGAGLTYSWRRGGTAVVNGGVISGQGTATLTLTNPTAANAGNYDVVISGTCTPAVTSSAVTVTVNAAPAITAQPTAPAAVCSGSGTQTISVTATGAGLTYSWRRGGTAVVNGGVISGQGTATLTLTNPTAANAGNYDVVISGTCTPAVTSSAVTVTVNAAPAITAQPTAPAAVCSGSGTQTISVTATGAGLTYSWRRGGTAVVNGGVISGQGTATLTLTNPTAANAGNYDVVISGTCTPAVTSSAVTVTVNAAPAITAQPTAPAAVCSGSGTQTISVTATGAGLTYSWRRGGTAVVNGGVISGQGTATLTLTNPTAANAGSYDVVVSGTCTPAVTSSAVTVTVNAAPAITAQPSAPAAVCSGSGTQTISVTATGAGLTYSWRRGGTAVVNGGVISGQGTATLTLTNPTAANAGSYDVVVSGTCTPAITSGAVTVTVNSLSIAPTSITGTTTICAGASTTLTLSGGTAGTGATAEWFSGSCGGTSVGSGNSITVSPAVNTNYYVRYNGTCNITTCASASITVTPSVGTPVFTLGTTSSRCLGAESVAYTASAANSTGITYSLDAASVTGGNSIDPATGIVTYVAAWSGTSIITASAAGCNGPAIATHTVTILGALVWTGAINSDWNVAGNWSCGILPDQTKPVQIPDVANKPVLGTGATGAVNNVLIDFGSSFTVTGNTIQISGSITNNGVFNAADGTVELNGSQAQNIGINVFAGNTIKDLIINNISGVTLLGPLNITGIVTAQNGNLASNGNLTLVSTSAQTALIAGSGTGNITGNVTMQRYLPSGFGYKYFSSPFQSSAVSEFGDDMTLGSYTFYRYDENRTASGWVNYNNPLNILNPSAGYAVNFGADPAAKTADITGVVNNGNIPVTLFNHNNAITQGFNLVGNPYPSPINWDIVKLNNTLINDAVYYFKSSTSDQYGGTYRAYVNGVSSDGTVNNIIPSMQGFFVHVANGAFPVTGNLTFTNSARISDLTHSFTYKKGGDSSIPLIRLSVSYSDDSDSHDAAVIYFDENATEEFDSHLDGLKLMNTDLKVPNLYSINSTGTKLSVGARPIMKDDSCTIPLGLKLNRDGEWTVIFRITDIDPSFSGMKIYISDTVAGVEQDLLGDKDYRITLAKGEYLNRFFLNMSSGTTDINDGVPSGSEMFSIYSSHGILKAEIKELIGNDGRLIVSNLTGQVLFIEEVSYTGYLEFNPGLKDGIYIVTYNTGTKRSSKKIPILNR